MFELSPSSPLLITLSLCAQVGEVTRGPFPKVSVEHCREQSEVSAAMSPVCPGAVCIMEPVAVFVNSGLEIRIEMSQPPNSHKPPWLQSSPEEDRAGAARGVGGSQEPWL